MSEQISSGELINVWKSLAISEEDIEETPEILGRGAYGTVYAAKYCGSPCVVKEMHSVLSKESCEQFYKEAMAMKSLSHPCILQLYGVTSKKDMPYSPTLVMEQLWKTLDNLIKVYQCLEMYTRLNLLRDVVCALSYLHSKKILHRDLTPNNILITESCTAKISDFGQATYFRPQGQMSTCPGNSLYMPPEALEANPIYSCKLDVFSFACVFIFTVTGVVPLPDDQFIRIHGPNFEKVNEANRRKDSISKLKSLKQRTVVLNCIEDNPDDRPNSKDLLPQVEDCMKEIQLDSLSKKSKIELDQECLERTMKVEKENSNLKQWNSDLSAKLDDAKNQLDDAKSQLKEKDVIITELQNETKTLTKVYNDARNELKRSPAVLKESSGFGVNSRNGSENSLIASDQGSDINSRNGSEKFVVASDQGENDSTDENNVAGDNDDDDDDDDDDDNESFYSTVDDLEKLENLEDCSGAFPPIQESQESDKSEVDSFSDKSEDSSSMPDLSDDGASIMDVIYKLHPYMAKYMNVQLLVRYLNKYSVLTRDERYHLRSSDKSPAEKVDYLLGCLDNKDEDSQRNFVKALKETREHTGHSKLCELLKKRGIKV